VRPPQPAGPHPPAPPPAPEPRSDPSTTTRHSPDRPARRRAPAASAQVSAHPAPARPPLRARTRWRALPLLGAAGLAVAPVGIAVLCPTGVPMAAVAAADPAAALGVGGWAASHASTAAIASACCCASRRPASPPSSCTSRVNPGGPGRARRARPRAWPAVGSRAGMGRGSGLGMHGSLLAHGCCAAGRVQSSAADGRWECCTRSRSRLDHANQGVRASARANGAERGPDHDPGPRLHGEVALNVARHRGPPATPSMDPGPTTGLARVAQPAGQPVLPGQPPGSPHGGGAPVDHPPVTDRSRGQRLVHRSITRHSAPQRLHHGIPNRRYGGPGGLHLPIPGSEGNHLCHAELPHRSAASRAL